jgi:segregation and condensation protein B
MSNSEEIEDVVPPAEAEEQGPDEGDEAADSADQPAAAPSNGEMTDLARQIEAVLVASDEPLTPSRASTLTGSTRRQVREAIDLLNSLYERHGHSFRIELIAEGYQILTLGQFNSLLEQFLAVRKDSKLSQAALETLAVVAYKQPVTRADIEIVRGVACGEVLRSLMEKRLVKIVGRAEVLGRPMLYGTTRRFLELFGLNSIEDLPKVEALTDPDKKELGPATEKK